MPSTLTEDTYKILCNQLLKHLGSIWALRWLESKKHPQLGLVLGQPHLEISWEHDVNH